METTAVVEFDYPVMIKNKEVSNITIRKTKMRDEINMSKTSLHPAEQEVWLVSAISDIPVKDLEEMYSDQYELITVAMGNLRYAHKDLAQKKLEEE